MRVAVTADVHGNLPALKAVYADIAGEGFDLVVDLGDVMWGWPWEAECLALVASRADVRVFGNADREAGVLGPHAVALDDVLFVHGTPSSDEGIVTKRSPPERVRAALEGTGARLVVGGHVHHQFTAAGGRWVNAGSVGMPYEGRPGAFWLAIVDGRPELRRTDYDLSLLPADSPHLPAVRGEITAEEAAEEFEP